jgi:hypothetical protein
LACNCGARWSLLSHTFLPEQARGGIASERTPACSLKDTRRGGGMLDAKATFTRR